MRALFVVTDTRKTLLSAAETERILHRSQGDNLHTTSSSITLARVISIRRQQTTRKGSRALFCSFHSFTLIEWKNIGPVRRTDRNVTKITRPSSGVINIRHWPVCLYVLSLLSIIPHPNPTFQLGSR